MEIEKKVPVPIEVPIIVSTTQDRVVPMEKIIEKAVEVPTIQDRIIEVIKEVPKIQEV